MLFGVGVVRKAIARYCLGVFSHEVGTVEGEFFLAILPLTPKLILPPPHPITHLHLLPLHLRLLIIPPSIRQPRQVLLPPHRVLPHKPETSSQLQIHIVKRRIVYVSLVEFLLFYLLVGFFADELFSG